MYKIITDNGRKTRLRAGVSIIVDLVNDDIENIKELKGKPFIIKKKVERKNITRLYIKLV